MKPKKIVVRTLAEFAKQTEIALKAAITTSPKFEGHWYRGIGNNNYELIPSLFRHPDKSLKIEDLLRIESYMIRDFGRQSVLHTEEKDEELGSDRELRRLFYMQHYGVPTRLLDWSSNPFIALYFALTGASVVAGAPDASVWILNPTSWNRVALAQRSHGDAGALSSEDAVTSHGPRPLYEGGVFAPTAITTLADQAVCCHGVANNARMFAQRGVFTIFGKSLDSMNKQFHDFRQPSSSLLQLVIPNNCTEQLLALLLKLGYTDSVSYPDLHGLAMEIKRTRGFKV